MPRIRPEALEAERRAARMHPDDRLAPLEREPEEVGQVASADGMNIDQKPEFLQCIAHDCPNDGVQMVTYEVETRWPNGRRLMGSLQFDALVCEEHFENLVRGRNVRV
jgi:hypothetical protein